MRRPTTTKAAAKKTGATRAKRGATAARRGRKPAQSDIGARIDQMIAELTALKAEVQTLDQMRTALKGLV